MSNVGVDGTATLDPMTFIVTVGGLIPSGFAILNAGCYLLALIMICTALLRQNETAKGRADYTAAQNLMFALWGALLAVTAELIGSYGKGIFGAEFESANVLLYVGKSEGSLAKTAMGAFLFLLQLVGGFSVATAIRVSSRLSTGKPVPGETWWSVFWFAGGGLALVFIQQTIGLISGLTGMGLAKFINNL